MHRVLPFHVAGLIVALLAAAGCVWPKPQQPLPASKLAYGIPYIRSAPSPRWSFPLGEKTHIVVAFNHASHEWVAEYNLDDSPQRYHQILSWSGDPFNLADTDFEFDDEHRAFVYAAKAAGYPEGEYWHVYRFEYDTLETELLYVSDKRIHRLLAFQEDTAVVVFTDQSIHVVRNNRLGTIRYKPDHRNRSRPVRSTRVACSRDFIAYSEHIDGPGETIAIVVPGRRLEDSLSLTEDVFGLVCAQDSSRIAVSMLFREDDAHKEEQVHSRTEIYTINKDERNRYSFSTNKPIIIPEARHAMFVPDSNLVIVGGMDPTTQDRWTRLYELDDVKAKLLGTIGCEWYLLQNHGTVTHDKITGDFTGLPGIRWTQPLPE